MSLDRKTPDRWTNAIIEITVPLDVPVDADPPAKQQAVGEVFDLFELPPNACASGRWEDVESDPRGGTIPLAPAPAGEGGERAALLRAMERITQIAENRRERDKVFALASTAIEEIRAALTALPVGETRGGGRLADLERVARYLLKASTLFDGYLADDERTDWRAKELPWHPNPSYMKHAGQRVLWLTREEWDDVGRVLGGARSERAPDPQQQDGLRCTCSLPPKGFLGYARDPRCPSHGDEGRAELRIGPLQQETETRPPKPEKAYGTCDWGGCDEPAVDHRWAAEPEHRAWLEVCSAHREETETRELERRFRKRPVEVEARPCGELLDAFRDDWSALPRWVSDAYERGEIVGVRNEGMTIKTLEGDHFARREDWLIQGVKGELYPCKPDIFEVTYEPAAASLPTGGGRDEAGVCDRGCCEWADDGLVLRYREHLDCRYCSDDATGRDRLGRPCCEACNPDEDELEPLCRWIFAPAAPSTGDGGKPESVCLRCGEVGDGPGPAHACGGTSNPGEVAPLRDCIEAFKRLPGIEGELDEISARAGGIEKTLDEVRGVLVRRGVVCEPVLAATVERLIVEREAARRALGQIDALTRAYVRGDDEAPETVGEIASIARRLLADQALATLDAAAASPSTGGGERGAAIDKLRVLRADMAEHEIDDPDVDADARNEWVRRLDQIHDELKRPAPSSSSGESGGGAVSVDALRAWVGTMRAQARFSTHHEVLDLFCAFLDKRSPAPPSPVPVCGDGLACARCGEKYAADGSWTVADGVGLLCRSCAPSMPPLDRIERPTLEELLTSDAAVEAFLGATIKGRYEIRNELRCRLEAVAARLSSTTKEGPGADSAR